uniref:Uncharacterized protein n=1 Tax=candidate division WWE3 bacterium TaxID=2053526 RepID=A0A7C4TLA5_UNCKA
MIEAIIPVAEAAAKVPTINPTGNLMDFMYTLLGRFLLLVGAAAIAFVIYGGVQFVMSGGDPEKVTKARRTLTWAVLGTILIVLSYFIVVTLDSIINQKL